MTSGCDMLRLGPATLDGSCEHPEFLEESGAKASTPVLNIV